MVSKLKKNFYVVILKENYFLKVFLVGIEGVFGIKGMVMGYILRGVVRVVFV